MCPDQVFLSVAEFAYLVGRDKRYIESQVRKGKIKGFQEVGKCGAWRIPETELAKYWGHLYGRPKKSEE